MTPFEIEQATLLKFLPDFSINRLTSRKKYSQNETFNKEYTLRLTPDGTIYIKETHCIDCGKRLIRNGHNPRIVVLDKDKGKRRFRIERKRCPYCGEIKPDYSKIAPKYGNYHENHKRRARQHYKNGLVPSQIQEVFQVDFGLRIPISTLISWIEQAAQPLRELLKKTPVPSSGYWGYDEVHMRIGGKRAYTLDTVDAVTHFVPAALISDSMGKMAGKRLFKEARRGQREWIKGIVKDCTTNLGKLLRNQSFKHVIQQNCLTHVKWIVSKHVKAFAGLSTRSIKPVPKQWQWLVKRFYAVIDSGNETNALVSLEILRGTIIKLNSKRVKHLETAFRNLVSWFPKILAHQRDPFLPATNNLLEGFHRKYTRCPSFKRAMMTLQGAQRKLDFLVFKHNFNRFPSYIIEFEAKYKKFLAFASEFKNRAGVSGRRSYFIARINKTNQWFGNYQQFWDDYLSIR